MYTKQKGAAQLQGIAAVVCGTSNSTKFPLFPPLFG